MTRGFYEPAADTTNFYVNVDNDMKNNCMWQLLMSVAVFVQCLWDLPNMC